jgi:hypothetical protein
MTPSRLAWAGLSILCAAACGSPSPSGLVSPPPPAPTSVRVPVPAPSGLASPSSDPVFVSLAKAALACRWKPDCTGRGCPNEPVPLAIDESCAAWKTWKSGTVSATTDGEATFVNMLEDTNVQIRLLGARRLELGSSRRWASNPELARRVIAAAAAESEEGNQITALAGAVGDIAYDTTGLWPAAKAAVEGSPNPLLKPIVLNAIGKYNAANQDVWRWALENAKATDGRGVSYLAHFHAGRQDDVCKAFVDFMNEHPKAGYPEQEMALESNGCPSSLEAALVATEAFLKTDAVADWGWVSAMENTLTNHGATDAQKKRAKAALESMARDTRSQGVYRAEALRRLHRIDKARGAALAASLTGDQNEYVVAAVKGVLATK